MVTSKVASSVDGCSPSVIGPHRPPSLPALSSSTTPSFTAVLSLPHRRLCSSSPLLPCVLRDKCCSSTITSSSEGKWANHGNHLRETASRKRTSSWPGRVCATHLGPRGRCRPSPGARMLSCSTSWAGRNQKQKEMLDNWIEQLTSALRTWYECRALPLS